GVSFDSYGYAVTGVDQRLTYAWLEALAILNDAHGKFEFDRWADKIERAARTLCAKRAKLASVRRFVVRVMGTSTNHVALDLATIYRAGVVLKQRDLRDFALPIARAMAADIHPDGYWDEHSDL